MADVISAVVSRLQIKYDFGFALFIEYENRATSMPENEFFFDVLRQQQAIWVENFLQDHKSEEISSSNDDNVQNNIFFF